MDSDGLGRLVDRHAAALELFARQWCDTPEDVVQEAFVKLAAARTPPDNPAAWLFRVVRNGALNAAQAARRRRRHETESASTSTDWFHPQQTAASSGLLDPETAAEELRSLPLDQREVIVAHIWGGLSFQEIALVSGCSASTAHRLYSSGLSALRERLGMSCRNNRPIRS
jgi:RNA polymerase sigma factor (sigma-70 family)